MADPTPAVDPTDIEAGMEAATVCGCSAGRKREVVTQVLAAVLPDHDARIRADERARVAEEIAQAIEVHPMLIGRSEAATVARQHATTEGIESR